ncbi:replication-associated recombination protein A [Flavobacteriales bacterium]|jgi:putative ATPase|nr:replication-associated recombination protein A [Flavobacteriales bacterium]
MNIPLAERLRPKNLEDYIGQSHLVGKQTVFRQAMDSGVLPSVILWGPPGVGKTTLAQIIAQQLKRDIYTLSAINSGVKDVREVIEKAKNRGLFGTESPVLFIDEIHRFSKSQQDSLLGAVETGIVTLIGATTENPSFEVIPALLSRCQVYTLEHFSKEDLQNLLQRAVSEDEKLVHKDITIREDKALLRLSGGDARKLLNVFELIVNSQSSLKIVIDDELVNKHAQQVLTSYDKGGEQHYDIASALIKSIRGSDPNAAVYWLARMIDGGEDAKFIARRLLISASEDIGNANPTALIMANNCFQAVSTIGMPESRIILSQCASYLASSEKSNAAYAAINKAMVAVKQMGSLSVPLHLRNAPTQLMKDLDYGKDYKYAHDYANNFVAQEFLPEGLKGHTFFEPGNNPREAAMREFLKIRWKDKYGY